MTSAVLSPCKSVCTIDGTSGLCRGCYRTCDEIAAWFTASDEGKRRILAAIAERRQAGVLQFLGG